MLSIILPSKEEPFLQDFINQINNGLSTKISYEIIVVDKSKITPEIKDAKIIKQESDGIGGAFKEGLEISNGDWIALMDCDGQYGIDDFKKMLENVPDYDLISAYKKVNEESFGRKIISKIMNWIARKRLGLEYKNCMSGIFIIRKDVLDKIELNPKGYKIGLEIFYKTKGMNLKTLEVPITFHKRKAGESKVGFNKKGFLEVIRIFKLINSLKRGE